MDGHDVLTPPTGAVHWDINNLVRELRQERLFVTSEQQELQHLNERVVNESNKLAQSAWVTSKQRLNLNRLILSRPDSSPASCCQRANALEVTRFVDAYKILPYQDCLVYGDFLQTLRASPEFLSQCLVIGEKVAPQQMIQILPCITSGLYGSLLLPHDTVLILRLLRHLTKLQLATCNNPRRMLRHGSSAFFHLYSAFHEGLFSAKLFLTAALQAPILQLLTDVEYFLDIDPDKAVVRFPPTTRLKKFGKEGTPEYASRIAGYRKWTINSLVEITTRFINNLHENLHCFPAPLSWLIKQIAGILTKSGNFDPKEVNEMITDLIFTHFICPAMVNPEPYGIVDTPISYISRFNLIQVAQIIQMLALIKYQEIDAKVQDLYNLFNKDCVTTLVDIILNDGTESLEELPLSVDSTELQGMIRTSALFTESELYSLVGFLQTISQSLAQTSDEASAILVSDASFELKLFSEHDREKLTLLLSGIPTKKLNGMVVSAPENDTTNGKVKRETMEGSPEAGSKKSSILVRVSKPLVNKTLSLTTNILNVDSNLINGTLNNEDISSTPNNLTSKTNSRPSSSESDDGTSQPEVLIISLNVPQIELIGLLPENKVLNMELNNGFSSSTNLDSVTLVNNVDDFVSEQDSEERDQIVSGPSGLVLSTGQEKRTRFSHSHDEGSIGNISDNLEAISEAASNHSVASSLELEENEDQNDNDNLSDMISANVSGRGTPNISGRDTPSSQVTEGEEGRQIGAEARQPFLPVAQPLINKQSRSEIDDKFCKFEIKKLLEGDETVSIISDTWSTDVLASDSETVEASERERPGNFLPSASERLERANVIVEGLDGVDAVSESAWSTDVLASDSERLTEVDTDDTTSVARSDDTARSEIEETPPIRLHRPIPISLPSQSSNVNVNPSVSISQMNPPNGPVSASSSQPSSPSDIPSPSLNNYSSRYSGNYSNNLTGNPNFSPSNAFRRIRDDQDSLTPNSPRRSTPPCTNVTGKGGRQSDYRRRTLEYVDSNANNIHSNHSISIDHSTMMRSEIIDHHSSSLSSILRNSSTETHNESNVRCEAVLVDSNSISANGIELLLNEKDKKIVSNSYKSTEETITQLVDIGPSTSGVLDTEPSLGNGTKKINGVQEISDIVVRLSNASINSTSSSITTSSTSSSDTNQPSGTAAVNKISEQWENRSSGVSKTQWFQNGISASTPNTFNVTDTSSSTLNNSSATVKSYTTPNSSKPGPSTGAIPKSISFDMTAEKGDKDLLDEDQKNKRGFFVKLKMGFRNRRGKPIRGAEEMISGRYEGSEGDLPRNRRYIFIDDGNGVANRTVEETSEDILAKYRRKPSDTNTSDSSSSGSKRKSSTEGAVASTIHNNANTLSSINDDERWTIDRSNVEGSFAFNDAKRKLRIVFSTASDQTSTWDVHIGRVGRIPNENLPDNELKSFLRLQLAKARNLCDWPLVALISETLRCVSLFDTAACRKLLLAMRQEHIKRGTYIRYLVRCRQELLSTLAHIDGLNTQITCDRQLSSSYLVTVCVRMFLERRELSVLEFCDEFQTLSLADEKTDLLNTFLLQLANEMEKDINWKDVSESQIALARIAIERALISRVYVHALFPNGEGDISRDLVLNKHIEKLSKTVTPNHKDLRIHKIFHYECPWTSAQEAISAISAYKTAEDKVKCVVRCATSIMHLLSLSSDRGCPTADDFTPVLVYVLIKANPPSLLSTIQYVNSFYGNRLKGEEQYWWIQFCSAVEFIKTMDYSD